ncbi:MAG TPA: SDR family oxidoreductase [Candidatus Limnocylindrales bacterium]
MDRLRGRACLVTGSTGMAAAAAELFAAEGAAVFVTSRTADHCRGLAERLGTSGGRVEWCAAELTEPEQVEAAVAACVAAFGRIDGLFSVAGGSGRRFGDGPAHALTPEGWEATFALNARTQALVAGAVARAMLAQPPLEGAGRGSILLMSSVLAFRPVPALFATHAYAAAKGAVAALARSMAASYAPQGIRVNAVAPSLVATPMSERAANDPTTAAYAVRKQPLAGGFLDPRDVAEAALFLLSDASRMVTGQLLTVDGGWSVTEAGA